HGIELLVAHRVLGRLGLGGDGGSARGDGRGRGRSCVVDDKSPARRRTGGRAADRTTGGRNEDVVQGLRALPEGRRHFHHHMILVLVLVNCRNLALAEGVVQRIVDLGGAQSQPGSSGAIDL